VVKSIEDNAKQIMPNIENLTLKNNPDDLKETLIMMIDQQKWALESFCTDGEILVFLSANKNLIGEQDDDCNK